MPTSIPPIMGPFMGGKLGSWASATSREFDEPLDPGVGSRVIGETISTIASSPRLARAAWGWCYKAEDLRLGRFVALKFLPPQLMRDEDARRRLFAEARAASTLDHANVCTIYDVEEMPDGRAFIAMAFVDGETLKTRLERGPVPPTEAARLMLQVAHGLARAHHAGIVHRDVKPGNIMITPDGHAKLLDFGIAKFAGGGDLTVPDDRRHDCVHVARTRARRCLRRARRRLGARRRVVRDAHRARPFTGRDDYELLQAIIERPVPPLPRPAERRAWAHRFTGPRPQSRSPLRQRRGDGACDRTDAAADGDRGDGRFRVSSGRSASSPSSRS